jgi:hypothetical protein
VTWLNFSELPWREVFQQPARQAKPRTLFTIGDAKPAEYPRDGIFDVFLRAASVGFTDHRRDIDVI